MEKAITNLQHEVSNASVTRQEAQNQLTELIQRRTELECTISDLKTSGTSASDTRQEIEAELEQVEIKIVQSKNMLDQLNPQWENHRAQEAKLKRELDEAATQLAALYSKQGRATKFRTKAERDNYLRRETASVQQYRDAQVAALEAAKAELITARQSQAEVEAEIVDTENKIDQGRTEVKDIGEQVVKDKDTLSRLTEERKDLWREDTKLDHLVAQATDEMRSAERGLAGMMDKVSGW